VAATRAKREIYFCCLEKTRGKNILELLQDLFPFMPVKDVPSTAVLHQSSSKTPEYEALQPVLDQWIKAQDAWSLRASALVDSVTNEAEKLEPSEADLAQIAARARASGGTLTGLLCHGALENWDFRDPAKLDQVLQMEKGKYARNFSKKQIDHAAKVSGEILRSFARSDAAGWLRRVEIVGREVPIVFFDRASQKILSGKIDLLVKEGERHCIVDYKTDVSLTDTMRRRYAEQMRIYRAALSESLAEEIACKLLLVRSGELIDV